VPPMPESKKPIGKLLVLISGKNKETYLKK
jgi:hypothetical protein